MGFSGSTWQESAGKLHEGFRAQELKTSQLSQERGKLREDREPKRSSKLFFQRNFCEMNNFKSEKRPSKWLLSGWPGTEPELETRTVGTVFPGNDLSLLSQRFDA